MKRVAFIIGMLLLPAAVLAYSAQLAWSPVPDVSGYKVYVRQGNQAYVTGTDVGSPALGQDGIVRTTLSAFASGVTYRLAVTAYNAMRVESALSNELSLLVAAPAEAQISELQFSLPPAATPQAYQAAANQTPLPTFPPAVVTPGFRVRQSPINPGDSVTLRWTDGQQWAGWSNAQIAVTRTATVTATATPSLSPTFSPTPTYTPLLPAVLSGVVLVTSP